MSVEIQLHKNYITTLVDKGSAEMEQPLILAYKLMNSHLKNEFKLAVIGVLSSALK